MLYMQIEELPALADGLCRTEAWQALRPMLGLPEDLTYAGAVSEWLGTFGLGSDDVILLGRARLGVVMTGLEAIASGGPDGPAVELRPKFAVLLDTGASEGTLNDVAGRKLPKLARHAYGDGLEVSSSERGGGIVTIARSPEPGRQIVWSVHQRVLVVANDEATLERVLATAGGEVTSLGTSAQLAALRREVRADDAAVFAYISSRGAGSLLGVGPGALAAGVTGETDAMTAVTRGFGNVVEGSVEAVGYSGTFEDGLFVDRYFTSLRPGVAKAAASLRPAADLPLSLDMVADGFSDATLLRVQRPGESADALLAAVSAHVDVAASMALTELAIELRRSYGVVPDEPVAPMLGDEILFVDSGDDSVLAAFEVRDRAGIERAVRRYLQANGARVSSLEANGVEILASTHDDQRAAAFVGRFVLLGTPAQIIAAVAARAGGGAAAGLAAVVAGRPNALVASQRADVEDAAMALAGIARLLRLKTPADEQLGSETKRNAIAAIPPALSVTEVARGGVYVETRSALGNLSLVSVLF